MPPRTENPTPAARIAMKPAQRRRFALGTIPSLLLIRVMLGLFEVRLCVGCVERFQAGVAIGERVCIRNQHSHKLNLGCRVSDGRARAACSLLWTGNRAT